MARHNFPTNGHTPYDRCRSRYFHVAARRSLRQDFGGSFERFGFAMITDHGIDPALIDDAWTKAKEFFALPEGEARLSSRAAAARGRTGVAKGAKSRPQGILACPARPARRHPLAAQQPSNVWPAEVAGFRETYDRLFAGIRPRRRQAALGIARYLGLAPDFFDDTVKDGNSVMRLLHYPPVEGPAKGIRAEAHEDINTITLLLGAEEAGLEILDKDGSWLPVSPPAGAMAVNVGDMLQRLTNNRLPSTTHRVRNPDAGRASVARYSMPFFLHFRSDYPIVTLDNCIDAEHPNLYPTPITADEYLQERLREIGLKK